MIIHIPHSSKTIPAEIRQDILLSDEQLAQELLRFTDHYVDELFSIHYKSVKTIRYDFSRLVADPERFRDDDKEQMTLHGLGAIYTSTLDGHMLRSISIEEKEYLKQKFYDKHHNNLENAVKEALLEHKKCLIIDAHSFPDIPLPFENKALHRPDICIGTDDFHTPSGLAEFTKKYFEQKMYSTAFNEPFAGTIVPLGYYQKDNRVHSIMIEINRSLYMDEDTGEKNIDFNKVKSVIQNYLSRLLVYEKEN